MANSIDDLKSTIQNHGGLAMQNRFNIIFTPPKLSLINLDASTLLAGLISGGGLSIKNFINDPRDISMMCKSTSMPGRQISTAEHAAHKEQHKYITGYIDEDVTCEFHVTQDFFIRNMFDNWMAQVLDSETYTVSYKVDHVADVVIQQLDKQNNPIYAVKLKNAFPTSYTGMTLSNEAADTPQTFSLTFSYDKFETLNPVAGFGSGIKSVADRIINIL
jgi:hypothetical protein